MIGLALQVSSAGAELRMTPALMVSEEFNDNIYLQPTNRVNDYITHIVPSVAFTYKASLWDWDGSMAYDYPYYYYSQSNFRNADTYRANINNLTRVVKDFLFLAIREEYSRVSLDVRQDYTQQSAFVNQTDRNILSVNPYATLHAGARTALDIGYLYRNTWYKDPNAIDKIDHIAYTEMKHDLTQKLTSTTSAMYTQNTNSVQDYTKIDVSAGLKYAYSDDSNIYGTIGNAWLSAETVGRESQIFWNAGFVQKFSKLSFTLETASSYVEDPQRVLRRVDSYSASLKREDERTSLGMTGSMMEYRNARTKNLENTSYSASGSISHMITMHSKVLLDLTFQRLEDNVYDTYYDVYLSGARYEYTGWESLSLSLAYRYTNNYDPYNYYSSYYNNRFFIEIKKAF